jgi:hypothetical protein
MEKVVISVRPDRREGALVGYGLRATKRGVGDRVEGHLERTARRKFYLIAYPPLMRLGRLNRTALPGKRRWQHSRLSRFEALKTVDVSRTETKYWP